MAKDLTSISDLSAQDVLAILADANRFRERHNQGIRREFVFDGHVVAMVFEKPSLRTKVSFEVAATYLGATPIFLTSEQILASGQQERGRESIVDIARNLERMADLLIARVYSHNTIRGMAAAVEIPVINALCDRHHPTQAIADLMTIEWHKGHLSGLTVAFVGDGNNVATSLMQACALVGIKFRISTPPGFELPAEEVSIAERLGGAVGQTHTPEDAVSGADVVYTDTFVSMGQESEKGKRLEAFAGHQVTMQLLEKAKSDAIFMHCLPAHRGEEVTDEVMDCEQSVVFDQAECRLHIAKALLHRYLGRHL